MFSTCRMMALMRLRFFLACLLMRIMFRLLAQFVLLVLCLAWLGLLIGMILKWEEIFSLLMVVFQRLSVLERLMGFILVLVFGLFLILSFLMNLGLIMFWTCLSRFCAGLFIIESVLFGIISSLILRVRLFCLRVIQSLKRVCLL